MRRISARRRFVCVVEPIESRTLLTATLSLHGPAVVKGDAAPALLTPIGSLQESYVTRDGKVALKIVIRDAGDFTSLQSGLAANGFVAATHVDKVLEGSAPVGSVAALKALSGVSSVQAIPTPPLAAAGSVVTQGDAALHADAARTAFGVDGTGVKVGVIADSFDKSDTSDAIDDVNSGDLPPLDQIQILDDSIPGDDGGRALMQLIHDIAPGAKLAFHTGAAMTDAGVILTDATMAQAIKDLADAGCNVIIDATGGLDEPMYSDGLAARAIDQASAQGVVCISPAANGGRTGYESAFADSGIDIVIDGQNVGRAHDFDPGPDVDIQQHITIPAGSSGLLEFQWDQPFLTASGVASASDVDMYIVEPTSSSIVASSTFDNTATGNGEPVELIGFNNITLFSEFDIVLVAFSGPLPGQMKYVNRQSVITIDEFDTKSPTLFGHANSKTGAAVGSAAWFQTPQFGVDPALKDPSSGVGGTPILFDNAGQRLAAPEQRLQPRFTATEGGNNTFFGQDIELDEDSSPNVFGTAAAAAEAAGVAALLKQLNPAATSQQVISALQSTALDMDDPDLPDFQTGRDDATGAGLIQADAALAAFGSGPKATEAFVSGSAWTQPFKDFLAAQSLGDAQNGFRLELPGAAAPLPWSNVNQLTVRFDRTVALATGDLSVTGSGGRTYTVQSTELDPAGTTLKITLAQPLLAGHVKVGFSAGQSANNIGPVEFNVLPGDVNRSGGAVQASDLVVTRNLTGRSTANPGTGATAYRPFVDVNADGVVNASDLVLVRNRIGTSAPAIRRPSLVFSFARIAPLDLKRTDDSDSTPA